MKLKRQAKRGAAAKPPERKRALSAAAMGFGA